MEGRKAQRAAMRGVEGMMADEAETIVAAAIQQGGMVCSVSRPGRHHDVIREMARAGIPTPIRGQQGFLTSSGRFVGRLEAVVIADEAKQIIQKTGPAHQLFSEDVW